jgi:tetratricopeptide (TPR) repeat protein
MSRFHHTVPASPPLSRALCVALLLLVAGCGGAADRKASYVAHGRKYLAAENYEKARVEFRNALQIDPKDAPAHFYLGKASERLHDLRAALGEYQAAIDLDPRQQEARAAAARLYVLGGAPDKALELAQAGLAADPQNPQLLTARGAARARLGDIKAGTEDAEAAIRLAPGDEYAVALMSSLYKQQGQGDKAIEVVRAGLQRLPANLDLHVMLADLYLGQQRPAEAEAELKHLIELDPRNLERRYMLARFYRQEHNTDAIESTLREAVAAAPDDDQPKLALIELLAQARGPDQAAAELQKYLKDAPNDNRLRLALAANLLRQNQPERAEALYHAVITEAGLKADGLAARDRLAELALSRDDASRAGAMVDEVLAESPGDHDALVIRANLALARGDAPAAIGDLRNALHDAPGDVATLRLLARAHLQNKEPALAEEALRTAQQAAPDDATVRLELAQVLQQTGKSDQALTLLSQLLSEQPDDPRLIEAMFRAQAEHGDLAAAWATAQSVQRRHADWPLGYFLAGLADEKDHKPDAAAADYERALAVAPQAPEPLVALVRLDLARKQPARALQRLDAAIARFPDDAYARKLKGELLLSQARYADAAQVYGEAIARQPQSAELYRGLARAQLGAGQADAAAASLRQGIEKSAGQGGGLVVELAELERHRGQADEAIATYEQALKRQPQSRLYANNLAVLLLARPDPAGLQRAQQLAVLLEGSAEPSFLDTRGWVQYKSGQYQAATALLRQAADKQPDDPTLRYHLAMAQLKNGDATSARGNLEAAVKSGRPFDELNEARAALSQLRRQTG